MRSSLPKLVVENKSFQKNRRKAFEQSFEKAHTLFCAKDSKGKGVDPLVSGTTCTCLLFEGSTIHIANVGDSRVILCRKGEDGGDQVMQLSSDHKPNRQDERKRLTPVVPFF